MKGKNRVVSLILAVAMIFGMVPWSVISFAEDNSSVQPQTVEITPLRRPKPDVSIYADPVTRVAFAQYSTASGSTIVAATPSGIPELNSDYATQAYAGETPSSTKIVLTINPFSSEYEGYNPRLLTDPIISCDNTTVTFSNLEIDGYDYTWTVTGGTADAGTCLKFKVLCSFTWDNPYTYTEVTDIYEIYTYSYVESICFPAGAHVYTTDGKSGSGSDELADVHYVSRIMGKNTYSDLATSGDYKRGYFDFVSTSFSEKSSTPDCSAVYWGPSRTHDNGATYINGSTAADSNRSKAIVYLDTSVDTITSLNLRMNFFQPVNLRNGSNSSGTQYYKGIFVKDGNVSYSTDTTSDSSAVSALGVRSVVVSPADSGLATMSGKGATVTETFTGSTTTAATYTLIPYFFTKNTKTSWTIASKNNHTRMATALEIVTVDKGSLRNAINAVTAYRTADGTGVGGTEPTGSYNGVQYYQKSFKGTGRGVVPQSWYYSNSSGFSSYQMSLDNAYKTLSNPRASSTDISKYESSLTQTYNALGFKGAATSTAYYGSDSVYNADYNNVMPSIGSINGSYYSSSNPYTALKPLDTLISHAVNGLSYQIYYKDSNVPSNILQYWPNDKAKYTAESVAALEQALETANQVKSTNFNVFYQITVDKAARELQTAIEGLEYAPLDISAAADVLAAADSMINACTPVYNPIVNDPYNYTSMSGTTYETQLPDGTALYTYKTVYRNSLINARSNVRAYTNTPDQYDSNDQEDFDSKVAALSNLLNNPQYAPIVTSYWNRTRTLVTEDLLSEISSEHVDHINGIIDSAYEILNATTEQQATLNALADELYYYLYREPADFSVVDQAISQASHKDNMITAENPSGEGRSELYYYTTASRSALQSLIDQAEAFRPTFDGEGQPVYVKYPIIDTDQVLDLAENIQTAILKLAVAGADFSFVKSELDISPFCPSSHYSNWSEYQAVVARAQAALNESGASESSDWQATNLKQSKYYSSNQAGENGPDAIALELFNARNALEHINSEVQFNLNYGNNEVYDIQNGDAGDDVVERPEIDPERGGYTMAGWYTEPECMNEAVLPNYFPTVNTVFYAKWNPNSYQVTFVGNGSTGGSMTSQSILYEDTANLKANSFQKQGHEFAGWALTEDGDVAYADGAPFTMNTFGATLYAKWSVKTYYIIYYVDGEEYVRVPYAYGAPITPYAEPSREGYTFSGWATHPETMPAADLRIMGSFSVNTQIVEYFVDDELYYTDHVAIGSAVREIEWPEKEGYTFSGWEGVPSVMPSVPVRVDGYFDINTYSIFYYVDNQLNYTARVKYDSVIRPHTPTKQGYTLSAWSPALPTKMPARSLTVYATFSPTVYNAVFMYDSTREYVTVPTAYGSQIVMPEDPVLEGYTFNGWDNLPQTMPASDVIITAKWLQAGYKLSFYVNGVQIYTGTFNTGDNISAPQYTPPTGYTFSGWSPAVPETMPDHDLNIYGTTAPKSVTLTFYVDGVIRNDLTITADYGTPVTAPIVSKQNYTFSGWSPEVPGTMPANDMSFYGTFTAIKATVSFDLNGGTGTVPTAVTDVIDANVPLPAQGDIEKQGYAFMGWATDPNAETPVSSFTVPVGGATLYAVWTEAQVELVAKEGSNTYIDNNKDIIFGVESGLSERQLREIFIEATGNGTIVFTASGRRMGTGTIITLCDAAGNEIKSYYLVVFGDVDGDGRITANDITAANDGLVNGFELDCFRTAANVYISPRNDRFNKDDVSELCRLFNDGLSQTEIADTLAYYSGLM
ncbi:MAG: InlB B-repeat-containing protein [Clostridiales bacterium]|nr:InlB B-repeat-containing protein [Clostridiales bacterium]